MAKEAIKILIVDDSPTDRKLLRRFIEGGRWARSQQAVVYEADTGQLGHESRLRDNPHCVLLDCLLPDVDGLEILAKLRNGNSHNHGFPAVVMVTGFGNEAVAAEAMRRGAQDFLVKDHLTADMLDVCIRRAVAVVRRRQRGIGKSAKLNHTKSQLQAAGELQRRMLPTASPRVPGFDIAGVCYPAAETGGDFFDYVTVSDHAVGIVLGDVSGHGLGPAILAADARAYLRAFSRTVTSPGQILLHSNQLLCDDTKGESFVTLVLVHLTPGSLVLRYAAAGHQAFVVRHSGTVCTLDSQQPPLGLGADMIAGCEAEIALQPGDLLLLMTDGITESTSTHDLPRSGATMFGVERALDVVRENRHRSAFNVIEQLLTQVRQFTAHHIQDDDMTVVVVKAESV
ncbi:MAG: SpoIIE family protein phosphatase [Candidatus Anammoximicrobium sp.]|nr:SpoIIE family protein phosphatase [Candidatus Anammoximicrobium sp.]